MPGVNTIGRSRGFTLTEIMLGCFLMALIAVVAVTNLKPSQSQAGSRALAQKVAGILESARARARSQQVPVALGLVSQNGATPLTRGLYLLEGPTRPRLTQALDLSQENSNSVIFSGVWTWDEAATATMGGSARGTPGDRFELPLWNAPYPKDPLLVFTPSGAVVSNLPQVEDQFMLVCCQGCQWTTTSLSGLPTYQLTGVSAPWTVRVTSGGQILAEPDLRLGSTVRRQAGALDGAALAITKPSLPANQNPDTPIITALPAPIPSTLPPGVDALVPTDGYLTLEATCHDPDEDALTIAWSGTGGSYSHSTPTPMQWDEERKLWVSHWVWAPPPGDNGTGRYTLTCQVNDGRNGTSTGVLGVSGRIDSIPTDKLAFNEEVKPLTGAVYTCITVCNPDGTDRRRLTDPAIKAYLPQWAPDGQSLVFLDLSANSVAEIQRDGTGLRTLIPGTALGGKPMDLAYRSDGTRLFISTSNSDLLEYKFADGSLRLIRAGAPGDQPSFTVSPSPPYNLVRSNSTWDTLNAIDPSNGAFQAVDTSALPPSARFGEPSFSSSGRFYAWGQGNSIWVADVQNGSSLKLTNPRRVAQGGAVVHNPVFSPNEQQLEFQLDTGVELNLWRANLDGTSMTQLTWRAGDVVSSDDAAWSLR